MPSFLPERVTAPEELVESLVQGGLVTAAVGLSGTPPNEPHCWSSGRLSRAVDRPPGPGSLFDLASLTKPWMATLGLLLDQQGVLSMDCELRRIWPGAAESLLDVRLEDLLRHRAGFRAWAPLYHLCSSLDEVTVSLLAGSHLGVAGQTYSDLGYLLWGLAAEKATQASLTDLADRYLIPLAGDGDLSHTLADDEAGVECLLDTSREVELAAAQSMAVALQQAPEPGQVQDGNARFLGRLCAHAGLFGSAVGLWRLGRAWLGESGELSEPLREQALKGDGEYLLGWARSEEADGSGAGLGQSSFGHVGFTGGSVWIDAEDHEIMVLLAHRTSPEADLIPWRRRFHELCRAV